MYLAEDLAANRHPGESRSLGGTNQDAGGQSGIGDFPLHSLRGTRNNGAAAPHGYAKKRGGAIRVLPAVRHVSAVTRRGCMSSSGNHVSRE